MYFIYLGIERSVSTQTWMFKSQVHGKIFDHMQAVRICCQMDR